MKDHAGGTTFNATMTKPSRLLSKSSYQARHVITPVPDWESRVEQDVTPLVSSTLRVPANRNLSLTSSDNPVEYVDIFVNDFIGLAQQYSKGRRVV